MKKTVTLPEIREPERMVLANNRLFITEGTSIYIYSIKDYKLVNKLLDPIFS